MERIDDLGGGYKIIQDTDGFCFGTDAVLLSDFTEVKTFETVADLCSGNGIIPILLSAKYKPKEILAVELQERAAELAERNMELNGLQECVRVLCEDIKKVRARMDKTVDVVTCNPPYTPWGGGYVSCKDAKVIARHEVFCTIEDVFCSVSKVLKFGGRMYLVHRAERLTDVVMAARKYRIEPKTVRFVHPRPEKAAKLFLMSFLYGGGRELKVLPPLMDFDCVEVLKQ